jgi:class 3 adenylate cyclase/tetratricopeptide (TPR) repeat protein
VEAGLTQEELAERARLSARAISDLERGVNRSARIHTVRQLAEALALSPADAAGFAAVARAETLAPHPVPAAAGPPTALSLGSEGTSEVRTFLFADVRGYTRFTLEHGDEAAARLAGKLATLAREGVTARGGEVIELRGDEVLAVFPSARQALRAALELQRRFDQELEADPELPITVGIGLDAGEAVPLEGGYRGGALNLAARLCSLAGPGEVLATEGVRHLARTVEGLRYIEGGPVQLKGFTDPVRVIRVVAAPPESDQEPSGDQVGAARRDVPLPVGGFLGSLPANALVARDDEMTPLLAAVDAVSRGEGRLVLLAGEAGVGKTRLAQELTLNAVGRGFLIAAGRCYEAQEAVPYYPFLEALSAAYGAAPSTVRQEAAHRWPYLGRLLPDQLGGTMPAAVSDSPEDQQRLYRAVVGFLQEIAQQVPIALMLDDLHWADSASLELLQHLARHTRSARILILGAYRDVEVNPQHALEAALRDLGREQLMERVAIRRLPEAGTAGLIAETLGEVEAASEFASLVHRHTDGNPFFTSQVVHALVESGSLYRQDGRWEWGTVQEIDVPESVRSVIGQRVSRLSEQAREMLHEASVLGQSFAFDDLLAIGDQDEEAVDDALGEAAAVGLVRAVENDSYVFDHALTQQALYAALSPRRRKRLHRAAGEALARLPERKRNTRAVELAWHFLQGDDAEQALPYALLAGEQAEAVFAHGEAEQRFRMALELAEDLGDASGQARAREKLGEVLKITGQYDTALDALEGAVGLYQSLHDSEGEGRVLAQVGLIHGVRSQPEDGIARLKPLVEARDTGQTSHSLALMYASLVRLYSRGGMSEQLAASERLLELARDLDDERLLAEAELYRGVSLKENGHYEEALRVLEAAIPRAESLGDFSTLSQALNVASLVEHGLHGLRRNDRGLIYREQALQVAEQLGDPREISYRALEYAYVMSLLGDWTRSRELAEHALSAVLAIDALTAYVGPLYMMCELCIYQGDWEDAAGYAREAVAVAQYLGLPESIREIQGLLADWDLLRGDRERALTRLQPFLADSGWEDHLNFLFPLARTYLATGNVAGAGDAAAQALAIATRDRILIGQIEALLIQASIATRQGELEDAEARFQHVLSRVAEVDYPWGEARIRYEHGRVCAARSELPAAQEELERARTLFEQLGARPFVARAVEAIRSL